MALLYFQTLVAGMEDALPWTRSDGHMAKSKTGRSGGAVDAPGKTHRKPAPADPREARASGQVAGLRAAKPMEKTKRLRGRG
jgi:hypothetical protein